MNILQLDINQIDKDWKSVVGYVNISVYHSVRDSVWDYVDGSVDSFVWRSVCSSIRNLVRRSI